MAESASNKKTGGELISPPASAYGPAATAGAEAGQDAPFVEIAVLVPLRPVFQPEAAPDSGHPAADNELRLFHYAVPDPLRGRLQPGHLVRVPFGTREVQGIIMHLQAETPVSAREVLDLSRPEPVLLPWQMELAAWMARFYVAPFPACLSLLVPPGVLSRKGTAGTVGARHDWQATLWIRPADIEPSLGRLGRATQQVRVLEWLRDHPQASLSPRELLRTCQLPASASQILRALHRKGWIRIDRQQGVSLLLDPGDMQEQLLQLRGTLKYRQWLQTLAAVGPMWKSDLKAPLPDLRWLAEHGLIHLQRRRRIRDPLAGETYEITSPLALTAVQASALRAITTRLCAPDGTPGRTVLLQGVTGSGKTEVYLQALAVCLAQGRQAIVLVPEIALTPQTIRRFAGRFPGRVSIMHSRLGAGERYDIWQQVHAGLVDVLVGPRSALFAPMARLGLIIMDEEHDDSYKQSAEEWGSRTVFYDARRVAGEMTRICGALLVMGSATPSIQVLARVLQGEVARAVLPERVRSATQDAESVALPPIELVDMRQELMAGNVSVFSRSLQAALHQVMAQKEQAILYMNRRGARTFVMCRACGHVMTCRTCAAPLTYHAEPVQLQCHTCARTYDIPRLCPACQDRRIRFFGAGTQLIEKELARMLPEARVVRWDADTTRTRGSHQAIMEQFRQHRADIVVGTQMIAKGLDLPLVTLVGVMAADIGLFLPDFRAPERTCQLLIQVAGRAGRSQRGGRVVIQTYSPEHYAIQAAASHDYEQFCQREIAFRQQMGYPPHRRLARLVYWDRSQPKAQRMAAAMKEVLVQAQGALGPKAQGLDIIGPVPPFRERIRAYWRWQILILGDDPAVLLHAVTIPQGWRVDLDPVSTL